MTKSLHQFDYKKSYIGNLAFTYVLFSHIIILIINIIFKSQFSCINFIFFYNTKNKNNENEISLMFYILKFIIPNLFFYYLKY